MDNLRYKNSLALVGVGKWGKNLARNFFQIGALHTLCDTVESQLSDYRSLFPNVRFRTDYKDVLKDPEITQIAIAAPSTFHYQLAKQALLAGKDVYVEKPLTLSFSECLELHQMALEAKLILMVGHILHYHPSIISMKEIIKSGNIGFVTHISAVRLHPDSFRNNENVLWDLGPHDLSVILSLIQQPLHSLNCWFSSNKKDQVQLSLKFADGISAQIHLSRNHSQKEQKLVVRGSQGTLLFDDTQAWGEKLVFYNQKKNHPYKVDHPVYEPLKNECIHFLQSCELRASPLTDSLEATRVIEVLEMAQKELLQINQSFCHQKQIFSSLTLN